MLYEKFIIPYILYRSTHISFFITFAQNKSKNNFFWYIFEWLRCGALIKMLPFFSYRQNKKKTEKNLSDSLHKVFCILFSCKLAETFFSPISSKPRRRDQLITNIKCSMCDLRKRHKTANCPKIKIQLI